MTRLADLAAERDVPTLLVDDDGVIERVNAAFTAVFGWSAEDLVGQPLSRIVPESLRDAHHLGFSRFLATGTGTVIGTKLALHALAHDGRQVPAEVLIVAEQHDGRWKFGATLRPR